MRLTGYTAAVVMTCVFGCAAEPTPMPREPIHNFYRVTDRIYSGAAPETEADFDALAALGVKTIITVDGAPPDVDAAARHGIRYVHLPVGYDGFDQHRGEQIAKAARDLPGPIFVHCHHGKHRGPTAAAICAIALDGWSSEQAVGFMRHAGTSDDYPGLFATAERFRRPNDAALDALPADFPATTKPPKLVDTMIAIDEHFDMLTAARSRGITAPPSDPPNDPRLDPRLDPTHQAFMLFERFRELNRQIAADPKHEHAAMADPAHDAEAKAAAMHEALRLVAGDDREANRNAADAAIAAVARNCRSCHAKFRN